MNVTLISTEICMTDWSACSLILHLVSALALFRIGMKEASWSAPRLLTNAAITFRFFILTSCPSSSANCNICYWNFRSYVSFFSLFIIYNVTSHTPCRTSLWGSLYNACTPGIKVVILSLLSWFINWFRLRNAYSLTSFSLSLSKLLKIPTKFISVDSAPKALIRLG